VNEVEAVSVGMERAEELNGVLSMEWEGISRLVDIINAENLAGKGS
jgi:hypothetical protein